MFSDKMKVADAEWKIESFKQGKKNTVDFMIEFNTLAMKADTDELHTIFLLKKNIWLNIIKMIVGYPPIVAPETLKEWKVVIMSVGQGYESTEGQHDYKMSTRTTYRGWGQPMDIGKSNDNFRDRKPKCFNCNKYGHMVKECQLKKKEDKWSCFKYDKEEHIAKNYKGMQSLKKHKVQKESDEEDDKKEQNFGDNLK